MRAPRVSDVISAKNEIEVINLKKQMSQLTERVDKLEKLVGELTVPVVKSTTAVVDKAFKEIASTKTPKKTTTKGK